MNRMSRKYGELARSAMRPRSGIFGPGRSLAQLRMGRREPGDRDPERGAGHVVQSYRVTELDARGVASVFAANADLEIPANLATLSDAYPHELTDPVAVDCLERVARENPLLDVIEEELWLRVIAAVSHRRLREVVRPEGEEFGVAGDFVRDESGPRDLNHRAELVVHGDPLPVHDALRLLLEGLSFDSQLLGQAYQRDHDLRADVDAFFLETARRFEDGAHLHLRDLGEHDPEATAPEAQHPGHHPQDAAELPPLHPPEVLQRSDVPPREVLEAGIQLGELAFEISTTVIRSRLHLLGERLALPFDLAVLGRREDHLMDDREPIRLHEHVFRPVEPDSLSAKFASTHGVPRVFGVGPHLEAPHIVRPGQQILEVDLAVEIRLNRPNRSREDLSRAAVDGEAVATADHLVADAEFGCVVVDLNVLAAGDTGDPETSRDHRSVARRAPPGRQAPFGMQDPLDIVGRCLDPGPDHRP